MGDTRFERAYRHLVQATDRPHALERMEDEAVVEALAAASRAADPLLANILATEALNRVRRLRQSLTNLGEGVVVLRRDGTVSWMNPAAERLLGWSRDELLGAAFHNVVGHMDAHLEPVTIDACAVLAAGRSFDPQVRDGEYFRTRDGRQLCVAYTSAAVRDEDGEVEGVVLAFQDCTARKLAEREVKVGRERYKSLFDQLPDPVLEVAPDATIREMNPALGAWTGRTLEEVQGRVFGEYVHPDDLERVFTAFAEVLEGARRDLEVRVLHADGRWLRAHVAATPVVVEGEVVGVHGLMRALADT